MTYGERLKQAMDYRSNAIGRTITRRELGKAVGCSGQNISMILMGSNGIDQKLSTESHAKAAAFLKVSPDWLLSETGSMEPKRHLNAPTELTTAAIEMAVLFDMIPVTDRIRRAKAFNAATSAILQVLQSEAAK